MRKQHFPEVTVNLLALLIFYRNFNIFQTQPHQLMAPVLLCSERHQRGVQLRHMMSCRLRKAIAIPRRACTGIGKTARADNHAVRPFFLSVFQPNPFCPAIRNQNTFHRTFQMQLHPIFLEVFFQCQHHIQRTVRHRKYTLASLHLQLQPLLLKKFLQAEAVQLVKGAV